MGVWTLLGCYFPNLRGKEPTASPFCLCQVSPLGQARAQLRLRQEEPDPREAKSPGFGRERAPGTPWASAAAPKWPGDVGLPCVQWIMTVFLVLSLFMPAL